MQDHIIHVLSIKGFAKEEALAVAAELEVSDMELIAQNLIDEGLLERSRIGVKLTEKGKAAAAKILEDVRQTTDLAALETFYQAFTPINQDYKKSVSSWQIKTVGESAEPNDHKDTEYDQQVLTEMFKDHDSLKHLVATCLASCPLLRAYARRLEIAYAHVSAGHHQFVTGALIDSYHTVWFEFHEALIRLSGRDRASEAAAGRAD